MYCRSPPVPMCAGRSVATALSSPDILDALRGAGVVDDYHQRVVLRAWEVTLFGLLQAAQSLVDPHCRDGWVDSLDFVRFVKVKAVAGAAALPDWHAAVTVAAAAGLPAPELPPPPPPPPVLAAVLPSTCEYIDGVMFRKSLPHKRMRTEVERPRVLLLDGGPVLCSAQCPSSLLCCPDPCCRRARV